MKSVHPPLYLLVAVMAFCLGASLDPPATMDSAPSHESAGSQPAITGGAIGNEPTKVDIDSRLEPEIDTELGIGEPIIETSGASCPLDGDVFALADSVVALVETQADKQTDKQTDKPKARLTAQQGPMLSTKFGNVEIFPADNPWNQDISQAKVHPDSETWLTSIGISRGLHPDFGTVWNGAPNGIAYVVVGPDQPKVPVSFEYDTESDAGPYPIPNDAPIEGGPKAADDSDRHVIVIDAQRKLLYELFHAFPDGRGWKAGSGAIFDLSTNTLRPKGWTSADAAGLPVFPGLVRYDEVAAGEIRHALRFTVRRTQRGYIFPARHFASRSNDAKLPPLGLRVRLRADYDISGFPKTTQVILTALKRYGMLLADNGSDWFMSGAPDPRWNDDDLATIKRVKGRDLECIVTGPIDR